jgi:hypothetical protein
MAMATQGRAFLLWVVVASLALGSGCARYRDWVWQTSGARPSLSAGDTVRDQVNNVNWLHADIFGIKKGLIDPDQPH